MKKTLTTLACLSLCGLSFVACQSVNSASDSQPLFNGKDLTGFSVKGGKAQYAYSNGILTGTAVVDVPNSFLATDQEYGNFVLEYDFLDDERLNSGVQIRSHAFDHDVFYTDAKGKAAKVPAGRVHGYQAEIDTNTKNLNSVDKKPRQWTAGLYEEGMRGWIVPGFGGGDSVRFSEQGRRLTKVGEWNHVKVEANGNRIRTWLNGEQRVDVRDDGDETGFIAFQVHGIGKNKDVAGATVQFRNVNITPIADNTLSATEKADGWVLLFDGKTHEGWRSAKGPNFPQSGWSVVDGTLRTAASGGKESAAAGDIVTLKQYKKFEVSVDFKLTTGANSGLKYYVQPDLNKGAGSAFGPEFQMLDDAVHPDAKLGRNGNRTCGSLYDLITAQNKRVNPIGEWNNAYVISDGNHVEHWLNGRLVVSYNRHTDEFRQLVKLSKYSDPKYGKGFGEWEEGHILLQEHGDEVWFKNVKLHDLSK
jgi:Domain of Unknown Function (DUF1080)